MEELYAKVEKRVTSRPPPLTPKPKLSIVGENDDDEIYTRPDVPDKSGLEPNYTEIVFDDDAPGYDVIVGVFPMHSCSRCARSR